jgi:hypothetical protein
MVARLHGRAVTMRIPEGEYKFNEFLEYLAKNEMKVFGGGERKQWLKVYLVYARDEWEQLFMEFPRKKLGDLTRISMQARGLSKPVEFYVYEWSPGILVFLTSSRREEYEKTLQRFIRFNRGITEMWIPRYLLTNVRNYLLDKYQAVIYSFISRRGRMSKFPARLRANFDRRLSYTGDDGTKVLKEVLDFYGVMPTSISFRIASDKLQITSRGMLLFRSVNLRTVEILKEVLSMVTKSQLRVREVSSTLRRDTKAIQLGKLEIRTPVVVPGIIKLEEKKLDRQTIEHFFKQEEAIETPSEFEQVEELEGKEFSFIDTSIREGSFSFSATVVDDIKGSMFGLSGSADSMVLVPMHRTTFESFIRFYRLVTESLDEEARFDVLSPTLS